MTSENQKWADLANRVQRGVDRHITPHPSAPTTVDDIYHAWRTGIIALAEENGTPLRVGPMGELNSKSAIGTLRLSGVKIEEVTAVALLTVLQDEEGDEHDH